MSPRTAQAVIIIVTGIGVGFCILSLVMFPSRLPVVLGLIGNIMTIAATVKRPDHPLAFASGGWSLACGVWMIT